MDLINLLWIFLIISSLTPVLRQRWLEASRVRLIQQLEQARGSRVITLIHRQEAMALLGIPLARYIDIDDSEEVLRAIRLTPVDLPIDLIVHTPGGLVLAAEQIAHALCRHKGPVTVMVPHYAMSGGTMLAMAADQIIMDENAVLGPIDPQLGTLPAASLVKVLTMKPMSDIDDQTLIMADVAEKALRQVKSTAIEILRANGMGPEKAEALATVLSEGRWTHDYPINLEEAQGLGLPVVGNLPEDVYALMALYPQQSQRRPSVQYVPLPYQPAPAHPAPGNNRPPS
ncbi:MAG: SDH family Clp fold serine proteinase [Chloroflexota bacterium]